MKGEENTDRFLAEGGYYKINRGGQKSCMIKRNRKKWKPQRQIEVKYSLGVRDIRLQGKRPRRTRTQGSGRKQTGLGEVIGDPSKQWAWRPMFLSKTLRLWESTYPSFKLYNQKATRIRMSFYSLWLFWIWFMISVSAYNWWFRNGMPNFST